MLSMRSTASLVGAVSFCLTAAGNGVVLNVRDFGAVGDGAIHSTEDWKDSARRKEFVKLLKPGSSAGDWSRDEAAFILARRALPPEGGTLYFPAGTYVATADSWRVLRDHVRILGDGAGRSVLTTGPRVAECLVLSGYRHVGWSRAYPFNPDDGAVGTLALHLAEAPQSGKLGPGDLVFIRDGANRYDQDYGEFNEVSRVGDGGAVDLVHPLARDYRLSSANWAGKLSKPFLIPRVGAPIEAEFSRQPGCFIPAPGDDVTVAGQSFHVESSGHGAQVRLVNVGRSNAPPGTPVPAGGLVSKERGLIVLASSTRGFRCEGITIRGRRKALDLSNSYDSSFVGCDIERIPAGARVIGGIVIDGDGGRFATFYRCTVKADPPCAMQFARSFGDVSFDQCHFVDADAAFTEFCFNCSVTNSSFEMSGRPRFRDVILIGWSCGNIRIAGNSIKAQGVETIFDARTDIQSPRHRSEGAVVVSDNAVSASDTGCIFAFDQRTPVDAKRNSVTGQFRAMGSKLPDGGQ